MFPRLAFLVALLVPACAVLGAQPPARSVALFDGKDLHGWSYLTPSHADIATVCRVEPGGVVAVRGKPVGYLLADGGAYRDFRLHVEWRWTTPNPRNNSGVLVDIASGPIDRKTWPICLQVQMKTRRAGDLLPMAGFTFAELPPGAKQTDRQKPCSEKPVGQWNSCDVVCRGDTVECWINGVWQNRATRVSAASGGIGLQLEGYPYELRNVVLAPL